MFKIKNITKKYKRQCAVNDVSLSFEDKGFNIIFGHSGSGKSTLLNIIGGVDSKTSGQILINDKVIKNLDNYRRYDVGHIFQEYNLLEDKSVYDNIAIIFRLLGISDSDLINDKIMTILKFLNIDKLYRKKAKELSGGQKQRVAIARALVKDPKLIIADEPTGNIDSKNTEEIMQILKEISKTRLVIMVSHNNEITQKYADRIIELEDGQVISDVKNDNIISKDTMFEMTDIKLNDIKKKNSFYPFKTAVKIAFSSNFNLTAGNITFRILLFISGIFLALASISLSSFLKIGTTGENLKYTKDTIYLSSVEEINTGIYNSGMLDRNTNKAFIDELITSNTAKYSFIPVGGENSSLVYLLNDNVNIVYGSIIDDNSVVVDKASLLNNIQNNQYNGVRSIEGFLKIQKLTTKPGKPIITAVADNIPFGSKYVSKKVLNTIYLETIKEKLQLFTHYTINLKDINKVNKTLLNDPNVSLNNLSYNSIIISNDIHLLEKYNFNILTGVNEQQTIYVDFNNLEYLAMFTSDSPSYLLFNNVNDDFMKIAKNHYDYVGFISDKIVSNSRNNQGFALNFITIFIVVVSIIIAFIFFFLYRSNLFKDIYSIRVLRLIGVKKKEIIKLYSFNIFFLILFTIFVSYFIMYILMSVTVFNTPALAKLIPFNILSFFVGILYAILIALVLGLLPVVLLLKKKPAEFMKKGEY